MAYCEANAIVNREANRAVAEAVRCRSWTCPNCAPRRKRKLIRDAHKGYPDTFLTLTSRRTPNKTANQAALELTHAWRLVRLRWMRLKKLKRLPFLAVMEATKLGWPHLHIMLRQHWMEKETLSEWMAELIDSPHVTIERIKSKSRIACYVAKYCGKCAHKFGNAKRYFQSRDYKIKEAGQSTDRPLLKGDWQFVEGTIASVAKEYSRQGWWVVWDSTTRFVAVGSGARSPPDPPQGGLS